MLDLSISVTTRSPRNKETHGKDYYFETLENFQRAIDEKQFAEYAVVFNNYYGTLTEEIQKMTAEGKDIVLDIDWQGAEKIKQQYGSRVVTLFIFPPTLEELQNRLEKRNEDSKESIDLRMTTAVNGIDKCKNYDYVILNKSIEQAIDDISSIIQSERIRHKNKKKLHAFLENLDSLNFFQDV